MYITIEFTRKTIIFLYYYVQFYVQLRGSFVHNREKIQAINEIILILLKTKYYTTTTT